jgi:hypothetical protein
MSMASDEVTEKFQDPLLVASQPDFRYLTRRFAPTGPARAGGDTRHTTKRENSMTGRDANPREPLLPARTALVLLMAVLVGIGAGVLTALAGHPGFEAALVGVGALGGATKFFHWLIN